MFSHTVLVQSTTIFDMMTFQACETHFPTVWFVLRRVTFPHHAVLLLKCRAAETSFLVLCLYYEVWLSTPGLLRHSDPHYAWPQRVNFHALLLRHSLRIKLVPWRVIFHALAAETPLFRITYCTAKGDFPSPACRETCFSLCRLNCLIFS